MYGVVLWSDKDDSRAVIWCEDHGDLAYYNGCGESAFDGFSLDAGDLITFTVNEGRDMRLATNPRLIAEQQYSGLVESLMAGGARMSLPVEPAPRRAPAGAETNVVQFVPLQPKNLLAS